MKKIALLFTIYSSLLGCNSSQINNIFSHLNDNKQSSNNFTSSDLISEIPKKQSIISLLY